MLVACELSQGAFYQIWGPAEMSLDSRQCSLQFLLFLGDLSPCQGAGPDDTLVMNRIWHKGWEVTSKVRVEKRPSFCLAL